MFKTFINIFRVPELRNKVLFTLFMLAIYRIGYHVPIPGVDQSSFAAAADKAGDDTAAGRLASYVSLFSGGNLSASTIFGLGVTPYISASIIFQLLTTVVPSLEKLQKEGETGRKKIQEWTRYATVPLALIQGIMWMSYMHHPGTGQPLVQPLFRNTTQFWVMGSFAVTAGCIFLMWLGEQIDEYGLGNGVSLIILAGIVGRMPDAIIRLVTQLNLGNSGDATRTMTPGKVLFLAAAFVFIIAGSILITQAQRRIPIQQAKHTRGRRVYGGQRQYLPLRVNHGGVMPIIFAQSLMLFPGMLFGWLSNSIRAAETASNTHSVWGRIFGFLNMEFNRGAFVYIVTEVAMIYFFAYFWTTVQFQPKEMANQLRDYGSFIPGLRPGKRTSDYLERVMQRITYVGAAFLCVLAVVPTAVSAWLVIDPNITQFLGGTGLLIVVSVALDMVQRIEANLLMRNYGGFLSGPGQKGKRIKGRQY
ncbi:MAG TPA: preprotein translocase subunit SecY [Tepidisphaeraceae bacterium]|nr:preprotein translocase subunit SecY [Tepidisphaeraceae bacterium]